MTSHPYISGANNITQMIGFLRKNFPQAVTSETVKKLGLASNNESYVINALQFLGIIDEEGKRTEPGQKIFALHDDAAFQKEFSDVVKSAYKDLFELRGDDAWSLSRNELIGYFRSADKTSEIIGTRQASVFQALRALSGHGVAEEGKPAPKGKVGPKPSIKPKAAASKSEKINIDNPIKHGSKDIALTVRIEINLPAGASSETYDNIFKSMKANLLNG